MTGHAVTHGSFTIKRHYPVSPARLFRAWSDKDELARWAAPSSDWTFSSEKFDFRVGGGELSQFGPRGEEPYLVNSRFDQIVPDTCIVSSFSITQGTQQISSSILSVEFGARDGGTELVLTEQCAFFDDLETIDMRRAGTETQLGQLAAYFEADTADIANAEAS